MHSLHIDRYHYAGTWMNPVRYSFVGSQLHTATFGLVLPMLLSGPDRRGIKIVVDTGSNESYLRKSELGEEHIEEVIAALEKKLGKTGLDLSNTEPDASPTIHGVMGFGGNGLGAAPFALLPSAKRHQFDLIAEPRIDQLQEQCVDNKLKQGSLDKKLLETSGRWVVSGYMAFGGKSVSTKMEIATGMHGIELPAPLYAELVALLRGAGIDPKPAPGIHSEFLSCFKCHDVLMRLKARILYQTSLSHSVVNVVDPIYSQPGGMYIFAVKPAQEEGLVRVGSNALSEWVMVFDRPNSQLLMCTKRQ